VIRFTCKKLAWRRQNYFRDELHHCHSRAPAVEEKVAEAVAPEAVEGAEVKEEEKKEKEEEKE